MEKSNARRLTHFILFGMISGVVTGAVLHHMIGANSARAVCSGGTL